MGILADHQIKDHPGLKIEPFHEGLNAESIISFGLSSYGYDIRLGYFFKVFTPTFTAVVDPKAFSDKTFIERDLRLRGHTWAPDRKYKTLRDDIHWHCVHCQVGGGPFKLADKPTEQFNPNPTTTRIDSPCPALEQPEQYLLIPPNSFVLGVSLEHIEVPRDVLAINLQKSTYARCGINTHATILEPEWRGYITLEISNTSSLPAKVYPGEGILQLIFLRTDGHNEAVLNTVRRLCGQEAQSDQRIHGRPSAASLLAAAETLLHHELSRGTCRVSYADRKGRYQDQGSTPVTPFVARSQGVTDEHVLGESDRVREGQDEVPSE